MRTLDRPELILTMLSSLDPVASWSWLLSYNILFRHASEKLENAFGKPEKRAS